MHFDFLAQAVRFLSSNIGINSRKTTAPAEDSPDSITATGPVSAAAEDSLDSTTAAGPVSAGRPPPLPPPPPPLPPPQNWSSVKMGRYGGNSVSASRSGKSQGGGLDAGSALVLLFGIVGFAVLMYFLTTNWDKLFGGSEQKQ